MKRILAVLAIACATAFQGQQALQNDVPAYHDKPPAKGEVLPLVLTQKQLAGAGFSAPVHLASYKAAARRPNVMYQVPCYCHCDKGHGHTSLHSCFETTHGAACGTCMAEALYAYKMSTPKKGKPGWTAKMIRNGIIRGDYKTIDLQHPDPIN